MRRRQDGLLEGADIHGGAAPALQRLARFTAQAQLGGVAQVACLVRPARGRLNSALVAVEQRDGQRQAYQVDALAVLGAVLATQADGEVGNPIGLLQGHGGLSLIHLPGSQAQLGGLAQARIEAGDGGW
ncbi:hypothetical protein D9M71_730390 [compost metagenome]